MDSAVTSVSLASSDLELLVSCLSGNLYRVAVSSLTEILVGSSHTAAIACIAFGSSAGYFATGTTAGELRVWDLADYACQALTRVPKAGAAHCLDILNSGHGLEGSLVVSGWADGFVRCHDMARLSRQLWVITNAHRGGVLSVAGHRDSALEFLVTGGADAAVRVWRLATRELFAQFSEQSKPVTRVLVDVRQPHLVHSVSLDGSLLSFDIKRQRRVVGHFIQKGSHLTSLSQRPDGEQELVTCDSGGKILMWDCDVRDPVQSLQDPSRTNIQCCSISPSGKFFAFAGEDFCVKVLRMDTFELVSVGLAHSGVVRTLAWTPDERQIISGSDDFSLCIWNFFLE